MLNCEPLLARTPLLHTGPEGGERECDCPSWVIRCAHFDGWMATLTDHSLSLTCPCRTAPFTGFMLVVASAPMSPCPWTGCPGISGWYMNQVVQCREIDTEAEALAAFHAAEEALLRGAE